MATSTARPIITLPLRTNLTHPTLSSSWQQQLRHASGHTKKAAKGDPRPLRHVQRKSGVPRDHQLRAAKKTEYHATHPSSSTSSDINSNYLTAPPQPILAPTVQETQPTELYFIHRTPTRNLPVYQEAKRGGNLKQTRVRKVEGETRELVRQLEAGLNPKPEWIRVNAVNGHVEMKGWYKGQVEGILIRKGF